MKLIVGLGNPGKRYAGTRHNVGWMVAERFAARARLAAWRKKFEAHLAEGRLGSEKIVVARPVTFMNESGRAVRPMLDFWKLSAADDLLVVVDDMALDVGRIRLRGGGSDGGHNGLASMTQHVGGGDYARLRVGIGPAPSKEEHVAFVLSPFAKAEREALDAAVDRAAEAAETWVARGLEAAMNRFNRPVESHEDAKDEKEEADRPTNHANA